MKKIDVAIMMGSKTDLETLQETAKILKDFGAAFVARWQLFEVSTQAGSKAEFLLPSHFRALRKLSPRYLQVYTQ